MKFKNCLFGATNKVKNSDKEKYVYGEYRIAFDSESSWRFGYEFARNVVIFAVDNSSGSHSDNRKNNFFILGEVIICGINGRFGLPEKRFSINFTKASTKFWLSLHYNADSKYLFVNGKEIFKFNAYIKNVNFPTQFCLGRYLMDLVLLYLEKYLEMKMYMIFQSTTILLINLTY